MKLSDISRIIEKYDGRYQEKERRELLRQFGYDMDNLYQELEMNSRFVDTHRDHSNPGANLQLHSHDFYELIYCDSRDTEYLLGSERYRLEKGDVILIPPGISHRPILSENMTEPYRREVIWISQEMMNVFLNLYGISAPDELTRGGLLRSNEAGRVQLEQLFHRGVLESERRNPGWEAAIFGNTMTLLVQMLRLMEERHTSLQAENPELLDQIIMYIEGNLSNKLSLEEISSHFFVSESSISQNFRHKIGISFHHYVTQRRMVAAKTLIQQGVALENVAEQIGFHDYSSFYRTFKKMIGLSPRQYRKMFMKEEKISDFFEENSRKI